MKKNNNNNKNKNNNEEEKKDVIPDDENMELEPEPESKCTDCEGTLLDGNVCNEVECLSLGDCKYTNYFFWPGGFCKPN